MGSQKIPVERVWFSHEITPEQGFRVLLKGPVTEDLIESLEFFVSMHKKIHLPETQEPK